jgi:predicted transcriptional regulator
VEQFDSTDCCRRAGAVAHTSSNPVSERHHYCTAMTIRLTEEQTAALRRRAEREGRSMHQVAVAALDDYLLRTDDDELTEQIAERGARRFAELLRRLGE